MTRWQHRIVVLLCAAGAISACSPAERPQAKETEKKTPVIGAEPRTIAPDPREVHFADLAMLTDGAENAEAYFAFDGNRLIFQSNRPPYGCDQIYTMPVDGGELQLASTGNGRTTCAYFFPDGEHVLYASTHLGDEQCPPAPDNSRGYVWPIYESYDIFRARTDGSELEPLTSARGYDAEATISPMGDRIVFTSTRDGDLDVYSMGLDGSDVQRLTSEIGYDGGPFFSPDGSMIVYRAHHPTDPEEISDYRSLLADDLIRPGKLEVWVMDSDGGNKRQVTELGAATFAPFFHPSGARIIFSSNHGSPDGREFELFMISLDGSGLEQITFSEGFDGFPMWSPDGRRFVFCSNRHNSQPGETNVFVTTWQE